MIPDNIIDTFAEDYAKGIKFTEAMARMKSAQVTLEGYRDTLRKIREDLPRAEQELQEAAKAFVALRAS